MSDRRILIVAHRTAASPKLLAAVADRAGRESCRFTLLVPRPYWDPDTEEAAITLELAIPLLDAAAGSHVQGIVGATDPVEAVRPSIRWASSASLLAPTPRHCEAGLVRPGAAE